jgi:predicted AAA+ superfamily ATPase
MEAFFRTHKYLVEHVQSPVRRLLMSEVDWTHRLIGIKGSRGVGKTTFLLQYAKDYFDPEDKTCLYINLNNFYFTNRSLVSFADEFRKSGGKTLLIDQVFKYPEWNKELRHIYDNFEDLHVVFTGSSVMRLKDTDENPDLAGCVHSYNLRGYSFREYLNLMSGENFKAYTLEEILENHQEIANEITAQIKPLAYFQDYLHHGYYPIFLEKTNFSENLLKIMNMIIEVDILLLKQMELKYLPKIRKLFYLLATNAINTPCSPNVSQLSVDIETSRATVMNYIKYLKDARMLNWLYSIDESFPKKPEKIYLQNTNQMYAIWPNNVSRKALCETFFVNNMVRDRKIHSGNQHDEFLIDEKYSFCVVAKDEKRKNNTKGYLAVDMIDVGNEKMIPLWLFGFLY